MRTITDHVTNPANDKITINVLDEPGQGGANHLYRISGYVAGNNPSAKEDMDWTGVYILFQNGPILEAGANGITQEALLAIVIDRLRSFQSGPYVCEENAEALSHAEQSLEALKKRTKARMERGVEGTHVL